VIQDLEETLVDVRSHAAKYIAESKSLNRTKIQIEREMRSWLDKAEIALQKKNREDLAKQALIEKAKAVSSLTNLQAECDAVEQQLSLITDDIAQLQQKLSEAQTKQSELLKREKFSSTRLKAKRAVRENNLQELELQYERVVRKIEQVESECEAFDLASSNDSLKSQFDELLVNENIEKEMSALKQKVANA
jgi:phage shock protein A